jgi:predicted ABC-type ATPase
MSDPVLHVLVGPNGAGKTTFFEHVLEPVTHLPFVNADLIAAKKWPRNQAARSYDAAQLAATERARLIAKRRSFVTETDFSHPSKLDLLEEAAEAGYLVTVHAILIPEDLAVARVPVRVSLGGHAVPEEKIRARYHRLWPQVAAAIAIADELVVYDNSRARRPFRVVARYRDGAAVKAPDWPPWAPGELSR